MNVYFGDRPPALDRIQYMTLEQQAEIIKLIEEIEAADKLTIPRIIISIDHAVWWIRAKNDRRYRSSKLGVSPIKVFVEYMREYHKLLIGEPTAQKVVEEIGSFQPLAQEVTFIVKGRSLESGLPKGIEVSSIEVREVLLSKSFDNEFLEGLRFFLNQTPFMHAISNEQLMQASLILRGSISQIKGFDEYLQSVTGLKVIRE